jgi:hypothetical protein
MTIQQRLDQYCIARCAGDKQSQIEIANHIIDEEVPQLIERLAEVMMERNKLASDVGTVCS